MHIHQRAPIDVEATLASLTLSEKVSLLSGPYPGHSSDQLHSFGIPSSTHVLQVLTSGTPWPSHPTTYPQ
jgi:hypothetical protein